MGAGPLPSILRKWTSRSSTRVLNWGETRSTAPRLRASRTHPANRRSARAYTQRWSRRLRGRRALRQGSGVSASRACGSSSALSGTCSGNGSISNPPLPPYLAGGETSFTCESKPNSLLSLGAPVRMPQFVPDLSHSNAKLRHPTLILFASKCAKKKGPKGPFQNPLQSA